MNFKLFRILILSLFIILGSVTPEFIYSASSINPNTEQTADRIISHTVTKGETAYSISKSYAISLERLYELNPQATMGLKTGDVLRISVSNPVNNSTSNKRKTYVVEPKETLYSISKNLDLSIEDIIRLNPDLRTKPLYIGQVLDVDNSEKGSSTFSEHKVSSKETLYGIAKDYNTTLDVLMAYNPELKNGLKEGSTIVIPKGNVNLQNSENIIRGGNALNIGLILPFNNKEDRQGARFVEYYEGLLLALEQLKQYGFSANIYVFDIGSDSNPKKLNSLLETTEIKNLDLIIGGVTNNQISTISNFAQINKIRYVIPFPTSSEVVKTNQFVFQVNEDATSLSLNVAKAFVRKFANSNVIFITGDDSKNDFKKDLNVQLLNSGIIPKSIASDNRLTSNLLTAIDSSKKNVLVATSGSINMLRPLLNSAAEVQQMMPAASITLFGQPEWQTYEQYIPQYSKYDTFIYTPFFVNDEEPNTKNFLAKYKKWYNQKDLIHTYPRYAILGYDTGLYFFTALMKYGSAFESQAALNSVLTLQTPFAFRRININGGYINTGFYFVNYTSANYIQKTTYSQW